MRPPTNVSHYQSNLIIRPKLNKLKDCALSLFLLQLELIEMNETRQDLQDDCRGAATAAIII